MIGKAIAHYRVLEKLGGGGMGVVYKAEDTKLKRIVALKFLPPGFSLDPEAKTRFTQEAQTASSLQHANICTIHDIDETADGQLFISMDYYDGVTLDRLIDQGPLDVSRALAIASQVAAGLAVAHEAGIVHRDIKPANIMVIRRDEVRILDFGLAKLAGQSKLTRTGSTLGTLAYMSPEQAGGEDVGPTSDVWALGAVFYEMLTGEPPFTARYQSALLYSILNDEVTAPRSVRPAIPEDVERIILRALSRDVSRRYPSAAELNSAITVAGSTPADSSAGPRGEWNMLRALKKPAIAVPFLLTLVALVAAVVWYLDTRVSIRVAREELIPRIRELSESGTTDKTDAYELALRAEELIPDDPELNALWEDIAGYVTIETDPPGARVSRAPYTSSDGEWEALGLSPIESLRVPIAFSRWKLEKEGYAPVIAVAGTQVVSEGRLIGSTIRRALDSAGSIPVGMVRVQGEGDIPDFLIDRFEVANEEFKAFVAQGGYQNRALWREEFSLEGRSLSWKEAMAYFVDRTGRPGPAGWQAGDYPEGEGRLPVAGISWYEAAAFAEFNGKALPTVEHWDLARGHHIGLNQWRIHGYIMPASNFGGTGPIPVGSSGAIQPFGTYDMAGNVREWCWNAAPMGRCLRGGAWDDATYMFNNITQASPFDRSLKNGFRCVQYFDRGMIPRQKFEPYTPLAVPDFRLEEPVSQEIFAIYRQQFDYDTKDLGEVLLESDSTKRDWIRQRVLVNVPYDEEQMVINLFLPNGVAPPYQTIVYFPGSGATHVRTSEHIAELPEFKRGVAFLLRSGRAVAIPAYKGAYERGSDSLAALHLWAEATHTYSGYQIALVKDFRRCLDYLETRPDIDAQRLAFMGFSWGGIVGNLCMAVEPRVRAGVVVAGGFDVHGRSRPEVDPVHFVPRITIPVLLLNGEYDMTFPLSLAVDPLFDMLGTSPARKKSCVYPTDHFIPQDEVIRETLAWLDAHLDPIRRVN